MRSRAAAVAVLLVLVLAGAFIRTGADAKDAKGCEGLGDYRAEMFKAGRDYLKANADDGIDMNKDPFLFSSDDFTNAADNILQYHRDLKAIEPPPFAEPWHQLEIDSTALGEQAFRAVASGGLFALLGFGDRIDANTAALDAAVVTVSKTCPDFASFHHDWDALDGEIDGTPVATPID